MRGSFLHSRNALAVPGRRNDGRQPPLRLRRDLLSLHGKAGMPGAIQHQQCLLITQQQLFASGDRQPEQPCRQVEFIPVHSNPQFAPQAEQRTADRMLRIPVRDSPTVCFHGYVPILSQANLRRRRITLSRGRHVVLRGGQLIAVEVHGIIGIEILAALLDTSQIVVQIQTVVRDLDDAPGDV